MCYLQEEGVGLAILAYCASEEKIGEGRKNEKCGIRDCGAVNKAGFTSGLAMLGSVKKVHKSLSAPPFAVFNNQ